MFQIFFFFGRTTHGHRCLFIQSWKLWILWASCALYLKASGWDSCRIHLQLFHFLKYEGNFWCFIFVHRHHIVCLCMIASNLHICTCWPKRQDPMLYKNLDAAAFRFSFLWSPNSRRWRQVDVHKGRLSILMPLCFSLRQSWTDVFVFFCPHHLTHLMQFQTRPDWRNILTFYLLSGWWEDRYHPHICPLNIKLQPAACQLSTKTGHGETAGRALFKF